MSMTKAGELLMGQITFGPSTGDPPFVPLLDWQWPTSNDSLPSREFPCPECVRLRLMLSAANEVIRNFERAQFQEGE